MSIINWSESLSVGVLSIDTQHKQLIALVNKLHDAMMASKGKEVLGGIFNELVTYTKTHFANEEKLFLQYSYPQVDSHKIEHNTLTKKALELQAEFNSGKLTISIATLNFLKDWLQNHIMVTDMKYKSFFIEKGVK